MHTAYGVGWLKDWVQCSVAQLNVLTVIILSFSLLLCVAALFVALANQWCKECCLSIFMLWIMHLFIHCSIMCPWVHWNYLSYETLTPCTPFIGQHILSSCLTESCSLEFQTTHLENFMDCKNKSWLLYFFSLYITCELDITNKCTESWSVDDKFVCWFVNWSLWPEASQTSRHFMIVRDYNCVP